MGRAPAIIGAHPGAVNWTSAASIEGAFLAALTAVLFVHSCAHRRGRAVIYDYLAQWASVRDAKRARPVAATAAGRMQRAGD